MTDGPGGRERLASYGMTEDEIGLWYDLAALAGRFLQLPMLHPSERNEAVVEFHQLQNRLLARPGLRAAGWPQG
jgi:hypothetical protein